MIRCHLRSYQYAAYGSNLHPVRLGKRVPSARLLGTCLLPGYVLKFDKVGWKDGSGKCNVVPGAQGVYLAIFQIRECERSKLDRCEGLGQGYDSVRFEAEGFGECSSYIADSSAVDQSLRPMDWYKEMVLLGSRANKFPSHYVQAIESVSVIRDPDEKRARQQWKIVEELRNGT
jgi:gamma-glutamylcyclotransferase